MELVDRRKVVLYGIGLEGEKFYSRFGGEVDIQYCIDQSEINSFHGISVFHLEEKKDELKHYFIIVAARDMVYEEICEILTQSGLCELVDFIHSNAYHKKIALIYGNCHLGVMKQYLIANYYFISQYYIRYWFVGEHKEMNLNMLSTIDLLITQDIQECNAFEMPAYTTLIQKIRKDAQVIIVPNLYGRNLFFPQYSDNLSQRAQERKNTSKKRAIPPKTDKEIVMGLIAMKDKMIDKLYLQGKNNSEIADEIANGNLFSEEDVISQFNSQMKKIEYRERKCSFIISDYIREHYKTEQLFYDPFHTTEELIMEKSKRVLHMLNIPIDEDIILTKSISGMEMPIYGCVKRILGISFEQKIMRRNCEWTVRNTPLTLQDYVNDYITWIRKKTM